VGILAGMAAVIAADTMGRVGLAKRAPLVDLDPWAPPDTEAVRTAYDLASRALSPAYLEHSRRCVLFSAVAHAQLCPSEPVDLEALHVAVMLHDVGLFLPAEPGERCFTVTGARHARRLLEAAGWDLKRIDAVATAITANLNPFVSARTFGDLAHLFRVGGLIDVMAQGWKVHPDNLASILSAHPRGELGSETRALVKAEVARHPRCRFATFGPVFPALVARRTFR
jgi:hypothetical protein